MPDYGRSNTGVKFPISFTLRPVGDLEPDMTVENELPSEQPPRVSTVSHIIELVMGLQGVVDKLKQDVSGVVDKQTSL